MDHIRDFFTNYLLACACFSWLLAQIIKLFTGVFTNEKLNLRKILFSSGGMPSSHSAAVCSLCTAAGIQCGTGSAEFAITMILSIIVMMDASGVRYETGKQAKVINEIVKELFSGRSDMVSTGLKELVGHTPFQVFMGALLGIAMGIGMGFLWGVI